jgi:hypothetical protein
MPLEDMWYLRFCFKFMIFLGNYLLWICECTLKEKKACFSETLVPVYQTARHHTEEICSLERKVPFQDIVDG